jgi:hypothetical protein
MPGLKAGDSTSCIPGLSVTFSVDNYAVVVTLHFDKCDHIEAVLWASVFNVVNLKESHRLQ